MKTKLEMAHEYAIALINSDCEMQFDKFIQLCWNYADAMQAEAEKREKQKDEDDAKSSKVLFEKLTDSRSLTKDEHGNCLHSHREFGHKKRMDCGASLEEWQPDWSQAPDWANWWVATADHDGKIFGGWFYDVRPELGVGKGSSIYYSSNSKNILTDSFGYTGDWRNSLRKRPK